MDCLFCKIVAGEVPAKRIYEDERTLAFFDISPAAPAHALIVPKAHYSSIIECDDADVLSALLMAAKEVASLLGLCESGYRIVINAGKYGGQTVEHLHLHMLGGRQMAWPPG